MNCENVRWGIMGCLGANGGVQEGKLKNNFFEREQYCKYFITLNMGSA